MLLERLKILLMTIPVLLLAIGSIVLFHLWDPLPAQQMRSTTFDQYQRWMPRQYTSMPVRVLAIDEESLARLGQWPWPRSFAAALVERLRGMGAAAIVFDVIYAEPDRTSPANVIDNWNVSPALRAALAALPDHDQVFADAIAGGGVVLGQAAEQGGAGAPALGPPPILRGAQAAPFLPHYASLMQPIPVLARAAAGLGAVNFAPASDGVVRRLPLMISIAGQAYPTLASEALRVAQDASSYQVLMTRTARKGVAAIRTGQLVIPTTTTGEAWVYYTPAVSQRTIAAWELFDEHFDPQRIQGHIVLIGATALGLFDLRFSPLGDVMPGVEAHAQFLEQTLSGISLQRPVWAESLELLAIMIGGFLLGSVAVLTGTLLSLLFALTSLAGLYYGSWTAFADHRLLLDPSIPSLSLVLCFIACSVIKHRASERKEKWVRDTFSHYVSPNLVEHLVSDAHALELGGEKRICSFVFTDLAGFTTLLEQLDPADTVDILNEYIDCMVRIAFDHHGTLDRIVGDAVVVMFSAPVEQINHADLALQCALEMHTFSKQFAAERTAGGIPFGNTRIGVHSGEVIIGNFGGSIIFDYRALGDPINTAARLESVNKLLGTLMCVSDDTIQRCTEPPAIIMRPVGHLILKGKQEPLLVFQPRPDLDAPDTAYEAAYQLLHEFEPVPALAAFEALAAERPDDPLVNFHVERLRKGSSGAVIKMTSK